MMGDGVLPGQGALVRVERAAGTELRVPVSAVVDPSGDDASVWRIVEGRARPTTVQVVGLRGQGPEARLAIEGDLTEKDLVVTAGHRHLLPDDAVSTRAAAERVAP